MVGRRARTVARSLPLAVDSALLVGLILTGVVGGHPAIAGDLPGLTGAPSVVGDLSAAELTVNPSSYWIRAGENFSLQALWTAESPLCSVVPLWYLWSVDEGSATGYLNSSTDSSTTFTADSFGSGDLAIKIRSGAALDCGSNATVFERTAEVHVSVAVPLSLDGMEIGPNPVLPGHVAVLVGSVTGGTRPYSLQVIWGDGSRSLVNQSSAGTFRVNHTFGSGTFVPYVLAADSEGELENRSAPEVVAVGTGLEAAVISANPTAEVGVPANFAGVEQDVPPGAVTIYDCTNGTLGSASWSPPEPNSTPFSCTFHAPGTAAVFFGVYPPGPGGPSASAVLYETVVSPPVLGVPDEAVGEVGGIALVPVSLTGGALPVSISWNLTGNRSGGSESVTSDGEGVVALPLDTAGLYSLEVRASDAFGSVGANHSLAMEVEPALDAEASGAGSLQSGGASVEVAGTVFSGCPPFFWWAVPAVVAVNEPPTNGALTAQGGFSWNATYGREGNLSVAVGVIDSCGAEWRTLLAVGLVPALTAELSATVDANSTAEILEINVSIDGGWPPFQLFVNASDNESWNQTIRSAGGHSCGFLTRGNGPLDLAATVWDSLGGRAEFTVTVLLPLRNSTPPPATETPGHTNGSLPVSSLGVIGLAAGLGVPTGIAMFRLILRRRRARKDEGPSPQPNPEAVLRRIIEPAEGAERFTVELLAEEAGIPLPLVRSTIDRLVSQGSIRSESGADGEEVLSWSSDRGH
ncbi:MAG TPA: hypothetical protein VEH28_08495 [Thermoplasmata archaeon]|nr:hypothetical protein [Thermoplasmata archaeon]